MVTQPISSVEPFDPLPFFLPLNQQLVSLLSTLTSEQWRSPSGVGRWTVHNLASHILDGALRRLAAQRDGWQAPPTTPIQGYTGLVAYVNDLNAAGVAGLSTWSPRQLIEAFERTEPEVVALFQSRAFDAEAFWPVAWAGERQSQHWMDVARDLTERWHHQQQLRVALGAPELTDAATTHAVLRTWFAGLPFAFRKTAGQAGEVLHVVVAGTGGGTWAMQYAHQWEWTHESTPTTTLTISASVLWRLYSKLLSPDSARADLRITGNAALAEPLLHYLPFLAVR
jgi:uncharacterized protein (TIGR03083 family)